MMIQVKELPAQGRVNSQTVHRQRVLKTLLPFCDILTAGALHVIEPRESINCRVTSRRVTSKLENACPEKSFNCPVICKFETAQCFRSKTSLDAMSRHLAAARYIEWQANVAVRTCALESTLLPGPRGQRVLAALWGFHTQQRRWCVFLTPSRNPC
jgi:hypothetical protein